MTPSLCPGEQLIREDDQGWDPDEPRSTSCANGFTSTGLHVWGCVLFLTPTGHRPSPYNEEGFPQVPHTVKMSSRYRAGIPPSWESISLICPAPIYDTFASGPIASPTSGLFRKEEFAVIVRAWYSHSTLQINLSTIPCTQPLAPWDKNCWKNNSPDNGSRTQFPLVGQVTL